jgi:hypothetical protein
MVLIGDIVAQANKSVEYLESTASTSCLLFAHKFGTVLILVFKINQRYTTRFRAIRCRTGAAAHGAKAVRRLKQTCGEGILIRRR